jgi:hypothetical protein
MARADIDSAAEPGLLATTEAGFWFVIICNYITLSAAAITWAVLPTTGESPGSDSASKFDRQCVITMETRAVSGYNPRYDQSGDDGAA